MNPYALRQFEVADWPSLKSIRLEALQTNPKVFGNSFLLESEFSDEFWIQRLAAEYNAVWGLYFEEELIGLTSVYGDANNSNVAQLTTSFIRIEHRGKGLAQRFFSTRIAWAKSRGIKTLSITHRKGNEASQKAILRAGFRYTHSEPKLWPDGITEENQCYSLSLE